MFRFFVLVLAFLAAAVFADKNFDEKFSQPMSEKDMTLGMSSIRKQNSFYYILLIFWIN